MDFSKKYDNPNPEEPANIISRLCFCWILPLFKYGYSNTIEIKDLYNTHKQDLSEQLGNVMEKHWQNELLREKETNEKPSLFRAMRSTFIKPFLILGFWQLFHTLACRFTQPSILAQLIKYFDKTKTSEAWEGWMWASILLGIILAQAVIMHYSYLQLSRIGMQCRVATSSLIYRKLLRLNKSSIGQTTAGQVVNLLSNDVTRFDVVALYYHFLWMTYIQTAVGTFLMYKIVGLAAFVGVAALVVQTVPLQGVLSRIRGKLRLKIAHQTDRRVQIMSEIISGIRVIKMYCWEKPFEKMTNTSRNLEMKKIAFSSYIWAVVYTIARFTERFTMFLTVIVYVYFGNYLSGDVVFALIQYFSLLHLYLAILFPIAVSSRAEAIVSIKRIEDFLLLDESSAAIDSNEVQTESSELKVGTIKVTNVKASWNTNVTIDTLKSINLHIKPGKIYAIVGSIGAGKSSLLKLFLKELAHNSGKVEINGDISYASQESWLFASSVRNNILFGLPYREEKYKTVIRICALEKDFTLLPDGDHTLVGEHGTSLSGGQRARINLARAIYRDADIYLLDDPLSSVDTHVGNHLFEECIVNYLKDKTRILVTHQLQFLKYVDQVIIIKTGQIKKIGTYQELSSGDLDGLNLKSFQTEATSRLTEKRRKSDQKIIDTLHEGATINNEEIEKESGETQELMEKGKIPSSLYAEYAKSGNGACILIFTVIVIVGTQIFFNVIDIWLARWTTAEEEYSAKTLNLLQSVNNDTTYTLIDTLDQNGTNLSELGQKNAINRSNYIYIYMALLAISVIFTACRSVTVYQICINASRRLHEKMFNNVLKTPIRFFDKNPSGRILNRFSKDLGIVDELLPKTLSESIQILSLVIGVLLVVFMVTPWMIVPTIILSTTFFLIRKIYLTTAQNVKRLEGSTKAPVLSHVSATIDGLTTIRVSRAQAMIAREFDILQDQHTSSYFLFLVCCEAFGFYLDIITTVFAGVLMFQFLAFDDGNSVGANIGLSITQALSLAGMLQYGVRQTTEVANYMVSVERLMQYTRLKEEMPFESDATKKPSRDWPESGKITFKNLTLQYDTMEPPILKNLNVEIEARSKVGVVGRTGAGKTSLSAALFRLAHTNGSITIDNVDIQEIGLHDLRSKVSIIPQEPVLFSASIRYNLDPLEKYDDKAIWKALEDVEVKEHIESLDQKVSEGGSNFSVGQRQLLCLARAILRNNKILVLDEATANVDIQTDKLIQTTIKKNFKDCTVITIAHRLNTVMDSDKVLVMDAGEIVEYGHAYELLQNKSGLFTKMLTETDSSMQQQLFKIAVDHYNIRFKNT